jgi:hypothetical protein
MHGIACSFHLKCYSDRWNDYVGFGVLMILVYPVRYKPHFPV